MTKQVTLSPSALSLFKDCPRCFWLEKVKNIKRPRGIFPSLPGGMDRVIKTYFDTYRSKRELPPELRTETFEGILLYENQARLDGWREWRTGLQYQEDGVVLSGMLDDLLVKGDQHIPFDYKTKGSPTSEEDATKYYQTQLDCYALMLEGNGLKTAGYGFLLYYSPKQVGENGNVQFELQPIRIATDIRRPKDLCHKAIEALTGPAPKASAKCEYCSWLEKFRK
ncbi:MAG TPA: PD-(D/E)XK nuclease family protein [Candidatus Omnitrophota bacterium]|nr:PD-(D/E)XK nuclease family protein [Candidatus Omnitrophota bacterium]HPS37416.1 PD-(D/E)XK nuclease family protein [Candidatus Omnitrophota bacterium]